MKEEIIQKLSEYHKQQGIIFTSEKDAIEYYRGLIELLESIKRGGEKIEQYQSQSYVEGGKVINCACDKCF